MEGRLLPRLGISCAPLPGKRTLDARPRTHRIARRAMRLLITGGAGFIGSHLARLAAGRHEVTVFDKLTYAGSLDNLKGLDVCFVQGDVAEPADVERAFSKGPFDVVLHLAAETHVDRSLKDPAPFLRTNVLGTQVLLDASRAFGVGRFVHVSTDEVYGPMQACQTASEEHPLRPSSPYAASKAAGDLLVLAARHTWGFPAIIARPSNNYGPRQYPEKMIPLFIVNALAGKALPVYGDGLQERDWLFVEDCARALLELAEADILRHTVYNISFGCPRPNIEVARMLLRLVGRDDSLIQHVADRPGHDRRYAPDSSRIRAELGWRPVVDFEEGLRVTVEWYRNLDRRGA